MEKGMKKEGRGTGLRWAAVDSQIGRPNGLVCNNGQATME